MELTKKERRELKRQERTIKIERIAKRAKFKLLVILGVAVLIVAAAGYFGYRSISKVASVEDIGEPVPIEGEKHISDGTTVNYKTNPPASGDHYGTPANWGVYDHEIPDEAAVHNLEHGGIWISYKPDIQSAAKQKLEEIAKIKTKVILSPRSKNDAPIAAVAWGRIYKPAVSADGAFDEESVKNFINKYINKGPELVPDSMPGKDY